MHTVEGIVGMLLLLLHIAGCCCLQRLAGENLLGSLQLDMLSLAHSFPFQWRCNRLLHLMIPMLLVYSLLIHLASLPRSKSLALVLMVSAPVYIQSPISNLLYEYCHTYMQLRGIRN
jgi:hypothetical protein